MTSATWQEVTRTLSHPGGWTQSPHALEGSWKACGRSGAAAGADPSPGLLTSVQECVGLCFLLTVFSPGWSAQPAGGNRLNSVKELPPSLQPVVAVLSLSSGGDCAAHHVNIIWRSHE